MKKLSILLLAIFALNIFSFAQEEAKDKDYYKYNWKLTDVYTNWDAWQKDLDLVKSQIPQYLEFKGRLNESAETMLEFQKFGSDFSRLYIKLYIYVLLNQDIDGKNPMYVTKIQELQTVGIERSRNTAWIQPELAIVPKETVDQWIKENKELAVFGHDFDSFYRQLEHILDEETQKVLTYYSKALSASGNAYGSLSKADMEFHKVTLSTGEEIVVSPANASRIYATNKVQGDRKTVEEAKAEAYSKNKNTYTDLWIGIAQNLWAGAQLQGYESYLESVLESNNIPKGVYMNLIEVASNNTSSLLKYRQLRKKALGLEKYYGSDEAIALVDYEKSYEWQEAVDIVLECLKPMGNEYNGLLNESVQGGWIDVYEKPGKQSGAYNMPMYDVHPYILMNWDKTQDNVYTLAHELGHAIHGMLSSKYQPYTYGRSATMVAEVASTFNENMLLDYMIKNTKDPNEKIALLVQAIDNISGTFYRQAQYAEFEYSLYSKIENDEPLNADIMANLYAEIEKKYNSGMMERSEAYNYSWPRVFHFFTHNYYVYNYAVSFSCSSSLFNQISQAESPEAAQKVQEKYLDLLKSGGSDYPVELLKKAGVDLTTKEPYLAVVKRLEELVDQLDVALKEAGKI
ncbi:MAG: oligoendopeptidase F [Bacteroidales bacterium]|nr:oligoendopeptidase F [Bacteroidales bacterium]